MNALIKAFCVVTTILVLPIAAIIELWESTKRER